MKAANFILLLAVLALPARGAEDALTGKTIHINDKSTAEWTGVPPTADNQSVYSEGEFVWRDAGDDDKGNGSYQYPQDPSLDRSADIQEFRVAFDRENLYLLITIRKPNEWWVPYRVVGIRTDQAADGLSPVFPQGAIETLNTYEGTYGEIKVAPELAPHFVLGISGTFKGRLWDRTGKLIAKCDGPDTGNDTPGFKIATVDWAQTQIAIPWQILGVPPPQGKSWKFVVGAGCQDYDRMREVDIEPSQWHGGGGEGRFNDDGPDPDVFDLVGASLAEQQEDLGNYTTGNNSPDHYSVIKKSFVEVKFGKLK